MLALPVLTDPTYVKPARYSAADRFALSLIKDERDLPFIWLTVRITLTLIPLGVALYLVPALSWAWWGLAAGYFYLNNFVFKGSFGLMLHCTSHRVFFNQKHQWLNHYLPWVLGPFFGQTPESYYVHHIGMHHPENNLEDDESTTMPYQRDSLRGFMRYYLDFIFLGVARVSAYFTRKNRPKFKFRLLRGEVVFYTGCLLLGLVNFPATFMVFLLPYLISRLIMMLGNWTQHAFIDGDDPGNALRNSVTCINTKYNHQCWNDGYHASHHQRPALHWTDHPKHFTDRLDEYVRDQAIVFSGIHFLHVFAFLMAKRYDKLAAHFVNLGDTYSSDAEVMAFLKARTAPVPFRKPVSAERYSVGV